MKKAKIQHDSEAAWLSAAYELLTQNGVEAVKIMPLAKKLGVARTGFYWHFKDREALLDAMIQRWEEKNTGNLVAQTNAYAETVAEAMFNLFDCWLDTTLFDAKLDLAIRNWARIDPALKVRLDSSDKKRHSAIRNMFERFGYPTAQADVRTTTVLLTQIGYISMQIEETQQQRIDRMPDYIEVFTGQRATLGEINRFLGRHGFAPKAA